MIFLAKISCKIAKITNIFANFHELLSIGGHDEQENKGAHH